MHPQCSALPELLLIVWFLMFVAKSTEPDLKGRNLKKSATRGAAGVLDGAKFVNSKVKHGKQHVREARAADEEEAARETTDHATGAISRVNLAGNKVGVRSSEAHTRHAYVAWCNSILCTRLRIFGGDCKLTMMSTNGTAVCLPTVRIEAG